MELEWDAGKAARNLNEHGVSFEDAALVFYEPGRIEACDGREDYGEDRWATIGGLPTRLSCMWSTPFDAGKPSASSLRGKPMPTKESNIVKRTVDLKNPPPLTAGQKARLDAVAAMPDAQIDDSDAPFLPDAVWTKAAVQLPHTKQQITLRIDAEVLDFFKHTGKRYQSRINAVLRSYVQAHKAHAK
ncbi:BrnA antitoxin family protein [Verminephrobacter eiseniae]|uniref:BrnA antitoxin family protein n=1 Tax=Verminephrobacter eiseniae TaxID=364317 RepID=UPI002238D77D|nr:BrnA antitoxin family protein [Verminephrobacter eiseniae]